jgi:hypothetical protein
VSGISVILAVYISGGTHGPVYSLSFEGNNNYLREIGTGSSWQDGTTGINELRSISASFVPGSGGHADVIGLTQRVSRVGVDACPQKE